MAFEFDTRLGESVFFPTVHIHDGTVHAEADFDHTLYVQSKTLDTRAAADYDGADSVDENTGFVRSIAAAKTFVSTALAQGLVDPELLVHKATLFGTLPNRDTVYELAATPKRAGCGRCDIGATGIPKPLSGMMTLAGLSWILARRVGGMKKR
jgi:hypothetical protein